MAETSGYIGDGYNLPGYIKAVKGLHPALKFTYRPMARADIMKLTYANQRDPENEEQLTVQTFTKHISAWDMKTPSGMAVAVSQDSLSKMQPRLFARLMQILMGTHPSDPEPEAEAISEPVVVSEETDAGN